MINFDGINAGADFVRADLHIHSFGEGGSFDVDDVTMTPENIVDSAIAKGILIIAITDHNEIENVQKALLCVKDKEILVIPGIEISTTQGHLLVYFETYDNLRRFFGKLTISDDKKTCNQGIVECLDFAQQFGGVGILAHIDLDSGFEKMMGRFGPHMENVLINKNLVGLEISNKQAIDFYTNDDVHVDRKRLIKMRREKLFLPFDYELPKFMSSDSHTLSKLGLNADGNSKMTRIKVDSLNFDSFCIAVQNGNSRIRIEDVIPERIPRFVGLKIQGGLLDDQIVKFSNNLTCIIGGRGAGKSTLLESLKECSGNGKKAQIVDSDVWAQEITLLFEDETGLIHELSREKNSEVLNATDPLNGISKIPIECYGQGDTASTIQHSDSNPQVLIDFLDAFIDLKALEIEDYEIRNLLIENQSEANKCRLDVENIPETQRQKANYEAKLAQLEKDKAGDLVKNQSALLKEKQIRNSIASDLRDLTGKYRNILADNSVFEDFKLLTDDEILVGKDYFGKVKQLVDDFSDIVEKTSNNLNESLTTKINELKEQLKNWAAKEEEIHKQINLKKAELEENGIPFDLGKINLIVKDTAFYRDRLKKLNLRKKHLEGLLIVRNQLIQRRKEVSEKIYQLRAAFAAKTNENLKNTIEGFAVSIKFEQGLYSPDFENQIKTLMEWKTSRVPKAEVLAKNISPLNFAIAVKKGNLNVLKDLKDESNTRVFSDGEVENILRRSKENNNYEDFETIVFQDRPSIKVTRSYINDEGAPAFLTKTLSQLSFGQQQSILLAILLQSKSNVPLVIDQPEDNLDSEFIYKTIVANLRRIKERRQVIIVTHNANIAVLGDAELIIPLKSTNIKSQVVNSGSIDKKETRELCCEILEGGHQAFRRRQEIYGIK